MDLLGIKSMTRDSVLSVLELADRFIDENGRPRTPAEFRGALNEQAIALMFFEPSTRTRVSFELAAQRLGAYPVVMMSQGSSIAKGESIRDTCQNLESMGVTGFVVRHAERGLPFALADELESAVINAGNGTGEHPTQALLDVFTLRRHFGRDDLSGLNIAIVGDIIHSRVARSDVYALRALGATPILAGPSRLLPKHNDGWDAEIAKTRSQALEAADAVIMLRIQKERMSNDLDVDDYVRDWGVDDSVVESEMQEDAPIMHPGPVIRGVELSNSVADGARSLILRQAGNGVAVRQAVLLLCLGGGQ